MEEKLELDGVMEDVREQNKQILEEIKNERSVNVIIEKLNILGEKNKERPMTQAYIAQMIVSLRWSLNLDFLNFALQLSDIEKTKRIYKQNLPSELKRLRKKLNNSKYGYVDINLVIRSLRKYFNEDEVDLFMFTVCRCINAHGKQFVNDMSLTLTQMFKNILMLSLDEFPEREELLDAIREYLDKLMN